MKIICIGRNYAAHAKELNNAVPTSPVFFLKPDTSLFRNNAPFFIPNHSNDVHHELELVIKINRLGKHIEERFAHKYFSEMTMGLDFTARDVQQNCKEKGLPWEIAKAFDGSAPLGKFVSAEPLKNGDLKFELLKNGALQQSGDTSDMIFNINQIISYVSKFMTLKIGDLMYTGTPTGVSKVEKGDILLGKLEGQELLSCKVL